MVKTSKESQKKSPNEREEAISDTRWFLWTLRDDVKAWVKKLADVSEKVGESAKKAGKISYETAKKAGKASLEAGKKVLERLNPSLWTRFSKYWEEILQMESGTMYESEFLWNDKKIRILETKNIEFNWNNCKIIWIYKDQWKEKNNSETFLLYDETTDTFYTVLTTEPAERRDPNIISKSNWRRIEPEHAKKYLDKIAKRIEEVHEQNDEIRDDEVDTYAQNESDREESDNLW